MTAPADDSAKSPLKAWVRALEMTAPIVRNPTVTLPTCIDTLAAKFGSAPALLSDEACLTYVELAQRCNRYARWALAQGIAAGDVVVLMMANSPDYLAIWLGVTRIGAIVALVNNQLVGDSLAHAVSVAAPQHVIVGAEFAAAIAAVRSRLVDLLSGPSPVPSAAVHELGAVTLHLPFEVADYVDFYASEHHAANLGRLFRPDAPPLLRPAGAGDRELTGGRSAACWLQDGSSAVPPELAKPAPGGVSPAATSAVATPVARSQS